MTAETKKQRKLIRAVSTKKTAGDTHLAQISNFIITPSYLTLKCYRCLNTIYKENYIVNNKLPQSWSTNGTVCDLNLIVAVESMPKV